MPIVDEKLKENLKPALMKLAKEWAKRANVAAGSSENQEKIVEVFVNLLFGTAELLMAGKAATPQEIGLMMTQRLAEQHMLLDDQLIKCLAASTGFLAGMPKTLEIGARGGVAGIAIAAAWTLADAITPGGECYLYYLDKQGEARIEALQRRLDERYRRNHAQPLPWEQLEYTPAETIQACSQFGLP